MFDPDTRLPAIPLDAVYNQTAGTFSALVFASAAFAVFLYGIKYWRDTKNPIILVMMLGGEAVVLVEPFLDIIGLAWHPMHGQDTVVEIIGRPLPLWVFCSYPMYFGGLGALNYLAFKKGVSTRVFWIWFCAPMLLDIVMEEAMMHYNLYVYYGEQPLIMPGLHFPYWWAPCNSMGELVSVSLFALMGNSLRGWKLLLIPIVMPIMDVMGYVMVGLPSIFAVMTNNLSPVTTQLAGVATYALTGMWVYGISLLVATDSPLRKGRTSLFAA